MTKIGEKEVVDSAAQEGEVKWRLSLPLSVSSPHRRLPRVLSNGGCARENKGRVVDLEGCSGTLYEQEDSRTSLGSGTITSSGNQCSQKVVAHLREVCCSR
ncbi:hypothetical protein ABZP36_022528 [Zizania latifolia]